MRLLVIGAVSGNGGDAAILHAEIETVREALGSEELTVDVVDSNPGVARRVVPGLDRVVGLKDPDALTPRRPTDRSLPSRAYRRVRRSLRRPRATAPAAGPLTMRMPRAEVLDLFQDADVVLYTGGTSLVEHYPLEEKFAHIEVALTARRPLVLGTQSLGPFQRPAHQEQVRRVTARASAVLLRDDRSLGNLGQIGADVSRAKVLPDIVFALADPRPQRPVTQRPRVAVSARAWNHFSGTSAAAGQASYVDALRGAVTWLVRERQAEVVFLSTCQGIDEYWIDDSLTASMIAAGLPEDVRQGVTVERGHRSPAELQDAYASFDVVLATRMHAAILSLNAGTPVVAVAYEFKTTELFRGLGLEELSHDIETVSAAGLTASLDHVLSHQGPVREVVAGKVVAWRREARELGLLVVSARRKRADS